MDLAALPAALYTVVLTLAAWQDLRTGEIEERMLRGLVLAGIAGALVHSWDRAAVQVPVLVGVVALLLNRGAWMGGADLTALVALAVAVPVHPVPGYSTPLPFPVSVFLLAMLLATGWLAMRGTMGVLRSGRWQRAFAITAGVAVVLWASYGSWDLLLLLDLLLLALLVQYLGRLAEHGGAPDPWAEVRFLPVVLGSLLLHLAGGDPLGWIFKVI
ncbi:MAG: hypothetical protein QGG50_06970 [Methanopyri archaeon]|nr:hypothetical protein [Methanopyri archaeon]